MRNGDKRNRPDTAASLLAPIGHKRQHQDVKRSSGNAGDQKTVISKTSDRIIESKSAPMLGNATDGNIIGLERLIPSQVTTLASCQLSAWMLERVFWSGAELVGAAMCPAF
jgi:hypothetical protein